MKVNLSVEQLHVLRKAAAYESSNQAWGRFSKGIWGLSDLTKLKLIKPAVNLGGHGYHPYKKLTSLGYQILKDYDISNIV